MILHSIILLSLLGLLLNGCTEEQQSRLTRLGVTWLEGNYRVTNADGEHVKSRGVRDSKVTPEPEKDYFFPGQSGQETLLRANPDCSNLYRGNPVVSKRRPIIREKQPFDTTAAMPAPAVV